MREAVVVKSSKKSFLREMGIVEVDRLCNLDVEALWFGELVFISRVEVNSSNEPTGEEG